MGERVKMKADIDPAAVTAIIDTREQLPLDLSPLRSERGTLRTGDYSVKGLENVVCLERKSLSDLLGCMGSSRERFEHELQRMLGYQTRAVIVEATWHELEAGEWQSKIKPASAIGSVLGWISGGVPFLFVGSHQRAGQYASRILYIVARRRWREARGFVNGVTEGQREPGGEG